MNIKNLETALFTTYGVGLLAAPQSAVEWVLATFPKANAVKTLKALNTKRAKHGLPLYYAAFGTHCF